MLSGASARAAVGLSGDRGPQTGSRSVRPSTPADAAAIAALFAQAGLRPHTEPQHLDWKYWRRRTDWPGPRSFVLTEGSELIAHAAIVPGAWNCGGHRATVLHLIDWAARGDVGGAGVMLMKAIAREAGALIAIGGSADTLGILPYLGFHAAGEVTGYVRTLRPLRLFDGAGRAPWRAPPRFTRGVAGALAAPAPAPGEFRARPIGAGDLEEIGAVLPLCGRGITVLERSAGLFAHALACPIVPMRLYLLEQAGRVRGYFLLASVVAQVRIADCWVDSDDPADWRSLIGCAVAEARLDPQAAEIVGWASDPWHEGAFRACGFLARTATPVQIRLPRGSAIPVGTLRVQMLDSDAAYLHEGRNEFWT
jgi:hypothetical protein